MLRHHRIGSRVHAFLGALLASAALLALAAPGLAAPQDSGRGRVPRGGAAPERPDAQGAAPAAAQGGELRFGITPALERKPGTLRLATYNVENLFDDVDDPELSGRHDDATMATSDDRCRAIAAAIRAVDADVLALQEVESLEALRWFRDRYLADMGYDFIASHDVGYYRGVEQSVLSRFPIVREKTWPEADLTVTASQRTGEGWSTPREGDGERFQRSPLYAQVRTPEGYVLDLIVVHHKAGGKDFAFHREAEALQVMTFVKERLAEDPNARIAILGDFNASPSEQSVKVYRDPAFGGLANAWEERFDRNRPRDTYVTHASGRVLDFIFMTEALRDDVVPKSFFVLATLTPPKNWNWRTDPHPPGYASDHRPVVIDIVPRIDGPRPPARESQLWGMAPKAPAEEAPAERTPAGKAASGSAGAPSNGTAPGKVKEPAPEPAPSRAPQTAAPAGG